MTRHDQQLDETVGGLAAGTEQALGEALRAAWAPTELRPELNEWLIAAALEDPLAEPTESERVESQRLRAALDGDGEHPGARLASVLRAAVAPAEANATASARLARRAVRPVRRGRVVYVVFGATAAITALAAGIALLLTPLARPADTMSPAASRRAMPGVAVSRSTAPLFRQKFRTGAATSRVDRIAMQRARELRSNRYAAWGIR